MKYNNRREYKTNRNQTSGPYYDHYYLNPGQDYHNTGNRFDHLIMTEIEDGVMMDLKSGHQLQEIIEIIKPLVPDLIGEVTKDMEIL